MSFIETYALKNSTIMLLYAEREEIRLDPYYQRMGGIWTKEKRQLLIDSILNDYDLPKIYFHEYSKEEQANTGFKFAVIDGRQRLETIWAFIEDKFVLSDDFEYQRDETINLAGLAYSDIAKQHPRIRIMFDSFVLPVVAVQTADDDLDLIEDMFSRLNEAVPLNAAEKRNALGGELVKAISELAVHPFFTERVRFGNKRFQHKEVAARFLLIEDGVATGRLLDTKKVYLDALVKRYSSDPVGARTLANEVYDVLEFMNKEFVLKDELLQAQGNLVIYYVVFKSALQADSGVKVNRRALIDFRESLKINRLLAETNYTESSYELLEYDRLSQQGTNDASSIRERVNILAVSLGVPLDDFWAKASGSATPLDSSPPSPP